MQFKNLQQFIDLLEKEGELLRSFEFGRSPWEPPASADYDILDYADLGDHERDPFVMRVQADEGGRHLHGHAH